MTRSLAAGFRQRGSLGGFAAQMPFGRMGIALAPIVIAVGLAAAAGTDTLPLALEALALVILLLIGLRSPVTILMLFAALIPAEDALTIGGPGTATVTKFVGFVFAAAYVINRRQLPRLAVIPAVGWAFVLWALASGLWTVDFAAWSVTILTLCQMFVLALLVGDLVSRDPPVASRVLWAYSLSALLVVLVFVAAPYLSGVTQARWQAFAGQDSLQFAAQLVPAFLFLVSGVGQATPNGERSKLIAVATMAGTAVLGWGLILTEGRGALLGLALGVVVLAATGTGRRRGRSLVLATIVLLAGIAVFTPGLVDPLVARFSDAAASGGSGRLDIWAVGAVIFAEHPVLGVGYGAFSSAYTSDVIRSAVVPGLAPTVLTPGWGASSLLVTTAAELGIVGVAFLGVFLWSVLAAKSGQSVGKLVRAALLATLAQAMLLDMFERKQLWLLVGIALGLAAATKKPAADAAGAEVPRRSVTRSTRARSRSAADRGS